MTKELEAEVKNKFNVTNTWITTTRWEWHHHYHQQVYIRNCHSLGHSLQTIK